MPSEKNQFCFIRQQSKFVGASIMLKNLKRKTDKNIGYGLIQLLFMILLCKCQCSEHLELHISCNSVLLRNPEISVNSYKLVPNELESRRSVRTIKASFGVYLRCVFCCK